MTFDWGEFVWAAETFCAMSTPQLEAQKNEALLRTAISRAYYAAFKECNLFHKKEWGAIKKLPATARDGMHSRFFASVEFYAANEADDELRAVYLTLAQDLRQLHNDRVRADYHAEVEDIVDLAPRALLYAKKIIATVSPGRVTG